MADPFSIIAGAAGLADVCIRLTKFLKEAKDGFQKIDRDLEDLTYEITALRTVSDLIKSSFEADLAETTNPRDTQIIANHWHTTRTTLEGCQKIVERLNALVTTILGTGVTKHVKFNNLRKYLKQQSKEDEFIALRQRLNTHHMALQISLAAVNIIYTRNARSTSNDSFSELSKKTQDLVADLQARIGSLKAVVESSGESSLDNAVRSAQNLVPLASLNKHFYTPQTVSSIFTGRATDLDTLRHCLQAPVSSNQVHAQKRFVVYGLPGSGKTQFCCKFAFDNKQSFWGIFWIDASSNEHAKQSFSTIARIGRVAPNERAAKNWLSTLGQEKPWLLIIDNADETSFPVEECYPDCNFGMILITTRNPTIRVQGTIGPRYYQFGELKETESIELLLRAADDPPPWSPSTLKYAKDICTTLGHLPLALMHAGKTILARQCTLENYTSFFEKNWARIRKMRSSNDARHISDSNAAIYSSYELIHDGMVARRTQASEDALELLKIFSFLHRQRIRADIFLRAASNPRLETLEQERREQEVRRINIDRKSVPWAQKFRSFGFGVLAFFLKLGYRPILPRMLSDALESKHFDELRLRQALKELFQMSLVFANPDPKDDSYSMHPAVHLWVRERPEMRIADQAVWCQAAATILSQALLLPPLGDKEDDEIFRRDLLPHVRHVQDNEDIIRARFLENQECRKRIWPVLQPRLDRTRAIQLVKFSLVYSQCGHLEAAEKLQLQVADFAMTMLGITHTTTMDILLLLSSTYWQLTRIEEAADLQKRVLDACISVRGKDDLKTLKIMDAYGSSRWQQGRIPEARKIHETAVDGYRHVLGDSHVDTLRAMGNLGRAFGKDFKFTQAVKIHSKVFSGLREKLGPSHLDTLIAKDSFAMAYYDRAAFGYGHRGDLDHAVEMEQEVFEQRKEKLGREHIYTLWAGLNLARIKALRGEIDEALSIFHAGHTIALRNLGENHFGVLWGKTHYGRILIYAKKYKEAEDVLSEVIESHRGPRKGHPDRLFAIFSLIKCRNILGKQAETTALLEELTESTKALCGEDHAFVKFLQDPRNLSKEPDEDNSSPIISENTGLARIAKYGHI